MKNFILNLLILITTFVTSYASDSGQKPDTLSFRSAFDPASQNWNIPWPGRVSQYDLLYLSPPQDPMQGIPLGNGETGVLFWCEDSRLVVAVNKSDLWDDAADGQFNNWKSEEEDLSTTLRHACRIIIDFRDPVFSTLYLADFKARLSLADGSASIESSSPFGKIKLIAYVDHLTGIIWFNLTSDLSEDIPVDIIIERFGSRTYSHWYSQINSNAGIGASGTEVFAGNEGAFVSQKLSSGNFAAGGKVLQDNDLNVNYSRESSHRALIRLTGSREKKAIMAFSVTSPENGDPVSEAQEKIAGAAKKGYDYSMKSNSDAWKSIWQRSFVDYGDDYLNSLWHLTMFYANASQGGKYPGRFNNGLWSWDRDVQNWNFYFHWNQQQIFWPLNAAGFHELIDPYLNFRFRSLPQAKRDAKERFGASGAFISDVTDRNGINSGSENANHTPVAEIALDFWRQYRYTGDKRFLTEKALPFITEAAQFFESLLKKEDDGLYHAIKGTGYEGWIQLHDGLTELVYAKALFATALEAVKIAGKNIPEAQRWRDILNHLAPLPVIRADDNEISTTTKGNILLKGFNRGSHISGDSIFAAGWGINENKWLTVYFPSDDTSNFGLKLLDGIFPSVPSSPVFPSGLIGLKDKGSPDFKNAYATTLLYGREVTGWDPVPIVMARLGMKHELETDLHNFPGRWQIYCNGWGHWGVEGEVNKDAEIFFRTNNVRDAAHPEREKFPLPMWPFRHMSMESMSVLAAAMNESLLQSCDGVIRIFPSFPDERSGRFTLHAEGGFLVSAEKSVKKVEWISLRSLSGNKCTVELPWGKTEVRSDLTKKVRIIEGNRAEIYTVKGEVITMVPSGTSGNVWDPQGEDPKPNERIRYHASGKTRLGIPRMF